MKIGVDATNLGPRQKELIAHIRANGGKVQFMKGLHPYFWVTVTEDPQRLVTLERTWSLIQRGLLVKVKDDWKSAVYELTERRTP